MSIDDNWGEALRKSAELITPGDKSETQLKVRTTSSALPANAATETTLDAFKTANHADLAALNTLLTSIRDNADMVETLLAAIGTNTDGLEGFTDGIEALLTTIRDNADTVESLLTALGLNTDGLETLVTATNSLLTTIRDNADTLETLIAATNALLITIRDNADTVETLIASTNTKLDTLHADLVGVEGKQDAQTALLTTIRDNADTIEALITSSNTKLDTVHADLVAVEGKQDAQTALLTTIRDNADTVEALITSSNTKLDTVHADLVAVEGKQDAHTALLTTIRDNADTLETLTGVVTETAPATDTASSGLNGRLQRIAQRLTSLIGFFVADFGVSSASIRTAAQIGNATGAAAFGSGTISAQTLRTVVASDQLPQDSIATLQQVTLTVTAGSTVEAKVGGATMTARTLLLLQPLSANFRWGPTSAGPVPAGRMGSQQLVSLNVRTAQQIFITNTGVSSADIVVWEGRNT